MVWPIRNLETKHKITWSAGWTNQRAVDNQRGDDKRIPAALHLVAYWVQSNGINIFSIFCMNLVWSSRFGDTLFNMYLLYTNVPKLQKHHVWCHAVLVVRNARQILGMWKQIFHIFLIQFNVQLYWGSTVYPAYFQVFASGLLSIAHTWRSIVRTYR